MTESILESDLFGHEAGAFTGAARTHTGHFERADGGTLVLDELATISLRMQEKILRVIEYGELQRVGGSDTLHVNVRIVGSTNADLQQRVQKGQFRDDLLDRLAFDVITLPPLRERIEDILPLAYAFAVNMVSELKQPCFPGFSSKASSLLLRHEWLGNVRELKNAVERSVYRADDLKNPIGEIAFDPFDSPFRLRTAAAPSAVAAPASCDDVRPLLPADLMATLRDTEKNLLQEALRKARFNQKVAAGLLGLSYDQLRGRIRKHRLQLQPG